MLTRRSPRASKMAGGSGGVTSVKTPDLPHVGGEYASEQAEHEAATLHFTVSLGKATAVGKLLDKGVDPNAVDYDGRTALHLAAGLGSLDICQLLTSRGAALDILDRWGRTPLDEAQSRGHVAVAEFLKGKGVKSGPGAGAMEVPDESAAMTLLDYASKGDVDNMVKLLDSGAASPDTADYDRRTAAHLAASENRLAVLRELVKRGANLNFADRWGNHCIDDAVRGGFAECVQFLRASGAEESTANASKPFVLTDPSPKGMNDLMRRGQKEFWVLGAGDFTMEDKPFAVGDEGEIFKGRWRELPVAVKTVRSKTASPQMLADFGNEIAVLSTIRHPNIVLFFGACFEHFPPSLLLEWCSGGSLDALLRQPRSDLDLKKKLRYAHELSLGMTFLHRCSVPIIHRDLNPTNVLLSGDDIVKVSDFGLAKYVPRGSKTLNDKFKMTGETGSYRYMAPEVFKHEPYNQAVDVYSFALVTYWLFAGAKPFANVIDPVDAVVSAAVEGARPSITALPDPRVGQLLAKCWSANPDDRPQFFEVSRALEVMRRG